MLCTIFFMKSLIEVKKSWALERIDEFIISLYQYPSRAPTAASSRNFHARVWKSDQGGRNSMQEMHGNQTKCMEFQRIKENSNF